MTRLLLVAILAMPAASALAGDPFAPCCLGESSPPSRSGAKIWFLNDRPERLAVSVARGPGAETQGFVAASGLTAAVGDGCGPVALRPRTRLVPPS
jgi:hypothetical protein